MYGITNVTSKGQNTIPGELRLLLHIQPGDKIIYQEADLSQRKYTAEVISTKNVVERLYGSMKSPVKYTNKKDIDKKVGLFLAKELGLIK